MASLQCQIVMFVFLKLLQLDLAVLAEVAGLLFAFLVFF